MISGATAHDADLVALDAILDEWASSNNYDDRVANLSAALLHAANLPDDGVVNILANTASANPSAWFLVRTRDTVTRQPDDDETLLP
jgi:hypothetical protein